MRSSDVMGAKERLLSAEMKLWSGRQNIYTEFSWGHHLENVNLEDTEGDESKTLRLI